MMEFTNRFSLCYMHVNFNLNVIEIKLRTSRDRLEKEVLKGVLLAAGVTAITNSKDKEYVIKK